MSPLEAAALALLLYLPLQWLVLRELDKLDDPGYLRRQGVVVLSERALDAHGEAVGIYRGLEIWGSVTFKGMLYRFDHIARSQEREHLNARELYLVPGLVYVTD